MSWLRKSLFLVMILVLLTIPFSFADDVDNSTVISEIDVGLDDSPVNDSEVLSSDNDQIDVGLDDSPVNDSEVLSSDEEAWIDLNKEEYIIDEDDNVLITGDIHIEIFDGSYPYELNVKCNYYDGDGILREYVSSYNGYEFTINSDNLEGLKARDSPYILTFTVVEDELFDEFVEGYYIDSIASATASLTINKVEDIGPAIPNYQSFTPNGKIYVSEEGSDSNDGSELNPYLTIQKALDRNKALGGSYEIIVKNGWYIFSEAYTISNNVRITGKGKVEILNGGSTNGYIFFTSGDNIIEFNNLTISGGTAGAISGSTSYGGDGNAKKVLNIINCTFEDNSGYVGVITTYSKTTIIQSSFINNKAMGYSSDSFRGLISARDNSLTVNFCNFIGNTLNSNNPLIYSEVKTNANYNFWANNEGPQSGDIISPKLTANYWAVLNPQLSNLSAVIGNDYDFDVKFMYTDSQGLFDNLKASMPNLNIKIDAKLGQINQFSTLENNITTLNYKATTKGLENITVSVNNKIINHLTFNVDVPDIDKIYVSANGNDTNVGNITSPLKTIGSAIQRNNELGGNKVIVILSGTYNEFDLEITDKLTIIGEEGVIIDADEKGRIAIVSADLDIYNVTFKNGRLESGDGGAIYHNSGNLNIYDCKFYSNFAENGGAINSQSTGNLGIYNSQFASNNINQNSKGVVIYSDSELTVKNSNFINNKAGESEGIIYIGNDAIISNNKFALNEALKGGAIYLNGGNNANIVVRGNNFNYNKASFGGAIYTEINFNTLIEDNLFNINSDSNGDAIYLKGMLSQNRIANNIFINNAIYIDSARVDLENNTITGDNYHITVNNGVVGNIIITFNENQTLKLKGGEISLNASVVDDMGNVITGGIISFTSNGMFIGNASVVKGQAILLKGLNTGNYTISGTYSGSDNLYPPLETKTSLLKVNIVDYWFINNVGYETLQEAIDAAEINDVICGIPGIYEEPIIQIGHRTRPAEPWVINKNITITSLGDSPVVLKASDRYIFYIDYYSNVTFRNIVFTGSNNPNGWGGAIDSMGKNTITVENCTFKDNIAEKGAAIYGYGNLYVKDSLFVNNTATVYGGAIVKDGDGDFILENVKFINNSAFTYSGAVDCRGYSEVIQIFKNITFEGNNATCAGALYTSGKNVTFIDCIFNNNKAVDKESGYSPLGGAVYVHYGATKFINTKFTNNFAEGTGGALQLENTVSSVVDSSGRHITIYWGILENCLIENNTALGDGGAIYTGNTFRTYINITNSIIKSNTAANGALFVNLYGFYTLNNVTAENNKNTAGSSLIYTYGMYSFPESFYANTNIINSNFKNNDAERFISTTTIYSSVNITNSVFENMGMLLYSFEGSICNLTNVRETNSKYSSYSIDNTGTLSLKNNSFANPIINKATINTPTSIHVCNNQTIIYEIGEPIKLEAIVVDDNNNTIIGHELVFVVNDVEFNSTFDSNCFVLDYSVEKGIQIIKASYNDAGLLNLTVKHAVIEGKSNLVIISPDITLYLKAEQFNVTVTDIKGNPVSDISLLINIGGTNYNVDSDLNGLVLINLDLSVGNYPINIKFNGDDRYNRVNINSTMHVLSTVKSSDAKKGYNSPYDFMATFLDINGNPLNKTKITLKVNNKDYIINTDENGVVKLTKLAVGTYSITSVNPATLEKVTNKVVILKRITNNKNLVMDYRDGSKFKVRLIGNDGKVVGAGEIVKFTLKGKTYKVKTKKNGYAYLPIKLVPKTYKITAEYKGYKISNKIKVKSVIKAKNISKKKSKKIKYTATLKTSKGKVLKAKKVIFKIKGKTYKAKTNKKGVAKVYLKNLKVGKYKVTIKYLSSTLKKTITVKK